MAAKKTSAEFMFLNNANYLFDYYNDINILILSKDSIKRSYCKCGNVEVGLIEKCPICGNDKALKMYVYGYYGKTYNVVKPIYKINYNRDKSIAYFNVYQVDVGIDVTKNEYVITKVSDKDIVSIDNMKIEILDNSFFIKRARGGVSTPIQVIESLAISEMDCFDFKSFKKEFKNYDNNFEEFNIKDIYNTYSKYYKVGDFQVYFLYLSIKNRLPDLFVGNNFKEYFITQLILNNSLCLTKDNTSFNDIVTGLGLDDFKEYLNQKWFYSFKHLQSYLANYNRLDDEQKELVKYAVAHYKMSADKLENFSNSILSKDSLYGGKLESLFMGFVKSNLVIFMDTTIDEFEKRVQFLNKHKIPINENSIKNFSVFKNIENLKAIGYPEKNINLISDVFYDNPIKSMKYLKSKKALTDKEINELIDLIK